MKKLLTLIAIFFLSLTLFSCEDQEIADVVPPNLNGVKNIDYRIGNPLPNLMDGVSAYDNIDGNITDQIVINDDDVDYETPGVYSLIYTISDSSGNQDTETVSFTILQSMTPIDLNPPTILNARNVFYAYGSNLPDYLEGLSAYDLEDGYITEHIIYDDSEVNLNVLGSYPLTYAVEDEARNSFSITVTLFVYDPVNPVISGLETMYYMIGSDLPDFLEGVTATDNYDGDITELIELNDEDFNPLLEGTYEISYTVSDSSDNQITETREVIVTSDPLPVIEGAVDFEVRVFSDAPNYMSGLTAYDELDGDLTSSITYDDSLVNLDMIGAYSLTYSIADLSNQIVSVTVLVHVMDDLAPTLSGVTDHTYYMSDDLPNLRFGVEAIDNYDGDLTSEIKIIENGINYGVVGTYDITYEITDSSENVTSLTVTLTVIDNVAPTINGATNLIYTMGETIDLLDGISAYDIVDGDLTAYLAFDDSLVNYEVEGTYLVTFSVLDSSSNIKEVTIELAVVSGSTSVLSYLNVYYINDTHGSIEPTDTEMGLAKIGNLIDDEKTNHPDETLFIGGGDLLQGSLLSNYFYGSSMMHILNELDMDAFVLGNHEFDWGIEVVTSYRDVNHPVYSVDFPILGANIFFDNTQTRPDYIDAYTIIEKQNIKVGIIGLMGYGIESSIATSRISDYYFADPIYWAGYYTEYLRNEEDVDLVLVVIHDDGRGSFNQTLSTWTGSKKVDAVFNGHSHQSYTYSYSRTGVDMPEIQSSSNGRQVGKVSFTFDYQGLVTSASASNLTSSNDSRLSTPSTRIQTIIDSYVNEVAPLLNETIITAGESISKSSLTFYMAKLMRMATDSDIGFHNSGGTRDDIYDGEAITVAKLYKIFPFDNKIKTSYVLGSEINAYINAYGSYNDIRPGISSFSSNTYYKVATNDYVFDMVDNPFIYGNQIEDTGILIRDILETVLRNQADLGLTFMISNPISF